MDASSVGVRTSTGRSLKTGLRPEPQEVRTPAAGAAHREINAGAWNPDSHGKSVFDRHSTQSAIAARLRREPERFKELGVDGGVYSAASPVDESQAARRQAPVFSAVSAYTARTPAELRRV